MPQNASHTPSPDPFEDELSAVLRSTGDTFGAEDPRELATGGLVRGRRRLARRRTGVIGGALALALIGVGGAYGGTLLGGQGDGTGSGDRTGREASVAGPKPVPHPADAMISVSAMADVLKANTPAGTWQIDDSGGIGSGISAVYDDGKGKAAVTVGLSRAERGPDSNAQSLVTCPDKVLVPYDDCTTEQVRGGRLMIFQGYEYPDRRVDTKNWRAVLLTRDGFLIDVSEYNAPTEKDSAVSRPNPPFSPAQLKTLVTAPGWGPLLGQLPVPLPAGGKPSSSASADVPGAPKFTDPSAARIHAAVRELLPKGRNLKVVAKGGDRGYAYVVVDDGKGRSLIEINVQGNMDDVRGDLFSSPDVVTQPDGTVVMTQKRDGEKGGAGVVWWTADTMGPDGFRVVVSAFNAGTQHQAATRSEPALTTEQLKDIALSPKWRAMSFT
ncbi:hypothetical protein [Streptomyces sp. NPDC090025]|uniref:hypothetical protein n=1 Tax=Streptomyces sp. NPDC090025 TaxID=3365922 RepID=UPI003832E6AE